MYDNSNLATRCRQLWAEVLCAVESRVWSINDYVGDPHTQLGCQMVNSDTVEIDHPSVKRSLVATLDLEEHAIDIEEFNDGSRTVRTKLPFALLGDGNVYVTYGKSLLGDPMAVARQLMSVLLADPAKPDADPKVDQFRSWASAIMTARAKRTPIKLPIEIQTENSVFPASTLDLSPVGAKIQSVAKLDRGSYVTVFRGSLGSFFRVVWTEPTDQGITRAGLVCLNPPLEWAEGVLQ